MMKKNKLIFILLLLSFMVGCKMDEPTDQGRSYDECIMVNESGVNVTIEILEEDYYVQFPTSLTLLPGMSYMWTVPYIQETNNFDKRGQNEFNWFAERRNCRMKSKDRPIYRPPFGDDVPKSAKIYFAGCPPVEYIGSHDYDRDPRKIDSYVYHENDKTNDKEYWRTFVYTFTAADYQNALKQ